METLGSGRRRGSPCRCPGRDRSALTLSPQFTPQDQPHAASSCAGSPGYPAGDSRTWTRVASSPQAEPPTPRRSRRCLRVCGVGGLWQDPHHAVDQGHCCRTAAGRRPETDLAQSGRVHSAATTSTAPEGPGPVRGRAHSTTWGWVWPGSAAQGRGAGCSSGPSLHFQATSFPLPFNAMETPKHSSLCCAKAGQRGRGGAGVRGSTRPRGQLP